MGISCCKSSNVYSISSCGKQPQWLVCSCYSSNVFPTNLTEMTVGRDALGKASVKLHHERSPWMHHTRHAVPLQCRKSKRDDKTEKIPGKAGKLRHAVYSFMQHDLWLLKFRSFHLSFTCCCLVKLTEHATVLQCGLLSAACSVQLQDGSCPRWHEHQVSEVLCLLFITVGCIWCASLWLEAVVWSWKPQ